MGTRSLTRFFNDDKEIACVYQQFDGYPSGVGAELAEFLASGKMVNGIPAGKPGKFFNGVGCLAAQFIAAFKKESGGLYLYPAGTNDVGEEYVYEVRGGYETPLTVKCFGYGKEEFSGDIEGFDAFCKQEEAE